MHKDNRTPIYVIIIFVLFTIGIIIAGVLYYKSNKKQFRTEVDNHLTAIADLKVSQIVLWRNERLADGNIFLNNDVFAENVISYLKNPNNLEGKNYIQTWLKKVKTSFDYDAVFLSDTSRTRRIIVSEKTERPKSLISPSKYDSLKSGKMVFEDFYRDETLQKIFLKVLIPVIDEKNNNQFIAIVELRIDPETYLYPLIESWPTPSKTSETLIAKREGDSAVFLNELKFRKNTALKDKISMERKDILIVKAILGEKGVVEGFDYKGDEVTGYVCSVPNSPWFMAARMDNAEMFAPMKEKLWWMRVISILLILCSGAGLGFIWKHQKVEFFKEKAEVTNELIVSETRYRRLFESAKDGVLILDAETGMINDVNPFLIDLLGYSHEEFIGKKIWDIGFFKDIFASYENFIELQQKEYIRYEDLKLETSNGKGINVEFVSNVYLVNNHKVIQCNIRDITERKNAEEDIKNSKKLLQRIIDILPIRIFWKDKNLKYLGCNKIFAKDAGKNNSEELIGLDDFQMNWKEQAKIYRDDDKSIIKSGVSKLNYEEPQTTPTGNKIWLNTSKMPLIDLKGNTIGILGTYEDITEHKQAEEKTQLLAHTIRSIDEIITITDLEDKFIFVNQAFCDIYGYTFEEIIGQHVKILLSPNNHPELLKDILKHSHTESWKGEILNLTKDGREFPISLQTSKIINEKGEIIGLVGISEDITEQKRVKEMLKKSEEKYQAIFESTGTATMVIEEDTSISMVNNECFLLTGYTAEELILTKWTNYVAPESLAEVMKYHNLRRADPGKAPKKYEVKLVHKNGEVREAMLDVGMIPGTKQSIVSILDITERKRAEEELYQSRNDWENTFETITDMITIHDADYNIIRANNAAKTYLGLPELDKLFNTKCFQYYHGGDNPPEGCPSCDCLKTGLPGTFELFEPHLNLHLEIRAIPRFDINNNLTGLVHVVRDITRRKLAEEAIRKNEEKYRTLIENMGEGIAITDKEEKFIFVNPAAEKMFGVGQGELADEYLSTFFSEEEFEEVKKRTNERRQGRSSSFEEEIILKDGSIKNISVTASPWYDDKIFKGTFAIFRDITEKKRIEIEVRKERRTAQNYLDIAGSMILALDPNQNILLANKTTCEILEYKEIDLIGKNWFDIFIPEGERERIKEGFIDLLKGNIKQREYSENFALTRRGEKRLIAWHNSLLRDETGQIIATLSSGEDITERKIAEELLKTSEEKYRNLIQTMPEGFYRSTPEGYFVDANPAFVNMLGYDNKEELMEVYIPDNLYFSKDDREVNVHNIDFTSDSDAYRLRKKDGSEIWVVDYGRFVKDDSGKVIFHEGIMRDVTESLHAQKAIIEAKDKAEEMSRLKSSFLANMSHEIRTPLNGIMGFAQLLQEDVKDDEQLSFVKVIEKSGNRLLETLDLILNFSKLEAEMVSAKYSEINISNVIDEVVDSFEAMAKIKNLVIEKKIKQKNLVTKIDDRFLRHVLNNLVKNAIVYTKKGGITVTFDQDEKDMIIKVKDTGIGIAKENFEVIFEPFRQESEGIGRNFEGTGLGLSITKRFVEMMKGNIEVESEAGAGSTFTVRLPFIDADATTEAKTGKKESAKKAPVDKTPEKKELSILLVENDEDNRDFALIVLNKYYKTEFAVDGQDAIDAAKKKNYDIILMDINLGKDIDGIMATKEIRKMKGYKDTPIVAMTAYVREGDKEEFLAGGCTHYLGKPFTVKQLLDLVEEIRQFKE